MAEEGRISRENFALITERLEWNSSQWRERILKGDPKFTSESFSDYWKDVNVPYGEGLVSHADSYRREWDKYHGFDYLSRNRLWFQRRLMELGS
jgi:hypothetical protein